jgi:hypothetical protein
MTDPRLEEMAAADRAVADAWRTASDAAWSGLTALRAVWPEKWHAISAADAESIRRALHSFEDAYAELQKAVVEAEDPAQ